MLCRRYNRHFAWFAAVLILPYLNRNLGHYISSAHFSFLCLLSVHIQFPVRLVFRGAFPKLNLLHSVPLFGIHGAIRPLIQTPLFFVQACFYPLPSLFQVSGGSCDFIQTLKDSKSSLEMFTLNVTVEWAVTYLVVGHPGFRYRLEYRLLLLMVSVIIFR